MMIRFRVAAFAALAALAVSSGAQSIQVNKENRTIAITATDKVVAIADQATLHIGFIAYGPDSNT
ncbi:MAG TPA: SIMPL domain-containing protein, partial [Edaphobacter sp.]